MSVLRRVSTSVCWLLFGAGFALAQTTTIAPTRFERVLWCGDVGAATAWASELGYTAVQLGRGTDAAVATGHGLGYYLDQPIGKGVFELRDDEWREVIRAYEQTRDPAMLVRPGCFATPGLVERLAGEAAAAAARVAGPGLRFVAVADEPSATRHDAPLDTCRCANCLVAFRTFARVRHPDLGALNEVLGTQFASFDDVVPPTVDQLRRRELGDAQLPNDLRAFALHRDFVDTQYAAAVHEVTAAVQRAVPGVPVGLTGLSAPAAFGGSDYARLLPGLTLAEPYDSGGAPELAASLLPTGAHRYATLFSPRAETPAAALSPTVWVRAQLAAMASQGLAGVVVWNDAAVRGADGALTPFGSAVRAGFTELGPVLDACAGAQVEPSPVWVVESQASVRLWWLLDSAQDGLTWVRRLSSYESEHSTSQAARRGWIHLLQDLGMAPRFVGERDLPERLLRERPRCLVLPATIALDDRAVQAIGVYVQNGGTVLADHSPALYDGNLLRRQAGGLDELFGVSERSWRWHDLLVREGRPLAAAGSLTLAERGLHGRIAERGEDGDTFLEQSVGRGRAVYLNTPVVGYSADRLDEQRIAHALELRRRVRAVLQQAGVAPPVAVRGEGLPTCVYSAALRLVDGRRVFAIRLNALDAPRLLQRLAQSGPRPIEIELPVARHLRLLGGADLGTATHFTLQLDPFGGVFVEDLGS